MAKNSVKRHAVVQPEDQSIKFIPLTKGRHAVVDTADYELLVRWNWIAKLSINGKAYAYRGPRVNEPHGRVWMHRVILGITDHAVEADHINGDGLDNRRSNLRPCSHIENSYNRTRKKASVSGFKGVSRHVNGLWRARIKSGGAQIATYHKTPQEARAAYVAAAIKHHGEFARVS